MTTHILTAPSKRNVTRWLFDPALQKTKGGRFFDQKTGAWRDRGFKKHNPVITLVAVDKEGTKSGPLEYVSAPYNGFVQDLPTEKCYFEPGDTIATFEDDYVYHWRFHNQKHKRGARVRTVVYRKFPRVLYGINLGIAMLIGLVGYLLTLTAGTFLSGIGVLLALASVPYIFFSAVLLILGKERGHHFLKNGYESVLFWRIWYGLIGLGYAFLTVGELFFGGGFSFVLLLLGLITIIAIDSMIAGAWNEGPLLSRFTQFLKKHVFRLKENGADT